MNETPPRLTFAVVNFRTAALLDLSLRVAAAELAPIGAELIVIDNSGEIDRNLVPSLGDFPSFRVVTNPVNQGFARGLNQAVAMSRAEYLLVANPDTFLRPGCVRTLIEALERDPGAAVAGPLVLDESGAIQGSARRFPGPQTGLFGRSTWLSKALPGNPITRREVRASDLAQEPGPHPVDWVSGACMLLRLADLKRVGGFDEGYFLYWEDADLCWRLKQAGRGTVFVPTASAVHLGGASSARDRMNSIEAFHRSAYRYYVRNCIPAGARVPRPVAALALGTRALASMAMEMARSILEPGRGGEAVTPDRIERALVADPRSTEG